MAVSKPKQTKFGIHHRLEGCATYKWIEDVLQKNIELPIEIICVIFRAFLVEYEQFSIKNNWSLIWDTRVVAHELFLKYHTKFKMQTDV